MDDSAFDSLSLAVAAASTRRRVIPLLFSLPLVAALIALVTPDTDAKDRRKRTKDRHNRRQKRRGKQKNRRRKHKETDRHRKQKAKQRQRRRQRDTTCVPDAMAVTCAGKCASVTNNCGQAVDCGPCDCGVCAQCTRCNPATGECDPAFEDLPCDDGDACTQTDTCQSGVCISGTPVSCPVCQTCDPSTGQCVADPAQNRTLCGGSGNETSVCCNGECCTGCCDIDGSCGSCLAFVTSTEYDGNLGGLSGADDKCQARAMAGPLPGANITGNYKAWLSNGTDGPDSRFRRSGEPYVLPEGGQIASSYAALVAGSGITTALGQTEFGGTVDTSHRVWTNTKTDGTPGSSSGTAGLCTDFDASLHCANWESAASDIDGGFGNPDLSFCAWTTYGQGGCNIDTRHLYCFQQT